MISNVYVIVCWFYIFICYGVIKCFVFVFGVLDRFYILFCLVFQFLVWEGQIMYCDFQCVIIFYFFMQFMIIVVGDIGKNSNDMFFIWCFIDDYFFFQCIQLVYQQFVCYVYWMCVVYVIYWFLNNMFVVISDVQYVVVSEDGFYFCYW